MVHHFFGRINFKRIVLIQLFFIFIFSILVPDRAQSANTDKVVVLPFQINTLKPLDHLKSGLQEMLTSRLAAKGLQMVSANTINRRASIYDTMLKQGNVIALGKDLGAKWIIQGSLTQIGENISLDINIINTTGDQPSSSLFVSEDSMNRLSDAVERAAVIIGNRVSGVILVGKIEVKGNKRIETEAILAVINSKEGSPLDNDLLDTDLRSIYRMGYFRDVRIETEESPMGKNIYVYVIEKPSITKILFEGNEKQDDDDLMDQLGIKKYSILNRSEVKQSINRLKEYYRQKGYYHVEISETIENLPDNEVSLTYNIKEGKKIYIKKIQFIGNTQIEAGDLKDEMETKQMWAFSWMTGSDKLDQKKLEFDVHKLTTYYRNKGFIKAKVGEPDVKFENEGLTITIEIIEGPRYKVNIVSIEGDLVKPADELLAETAIKQEKFYNMEVVRTDTLTLRDIYGEDGYAYADVAPIIKEDDEKHLVDIHFKISKGKRVRFERINITGNYITRDKVIRREFKFAEGDYFNGTALKRGTTNLYRLGFFEKVDIQTKKGSQDDLMILDIDVAEQPTGEFSLGVGYSSYEKTLTQFQLAKRNFLGRGQDVSAKASFGSRTTNYTISFREPWLFDKPLSAGISLYEWKYESEYDQYDQNTRGGSLSFGFPLKFDYTRGSVKYALDQTEIHNVTEDAYQEIKDQEGTSVASSITLGITRNSKNRYQMASEGSLNRFSFEYAGGFLGGDAAFNKYLVTSAWYFPLKWDTIFMAQGRAGYVEKRPEGTLPYGEKFKLGGINSIRGYGYGDISPKSPAGRSVGGEKMWVTNFEYLFPLQKEQGVMGLIFFDAGNAYRESDNIFKRDDDFFLTARRSYGAGIRWNTPLGLLRLEYGIKLDREEGESKGDWEFTIGGAF